MKQLANRTQLTSQTGLEDLIPDLTGDIISFAGGLPDASLFPQKELAASFQRVLATSTAQPLQYHNAKGFMPLKENLADRLQQHGDNTTADQILLTQGAQQGLDLVAKLLLNKNDRIAVEAPTYIGALAAFAAYEPNYLEITMEADGPDLNQLEKALPTTPIKFMYVIPNFQNPTGVVMSLAKRERLLALADKYDFLVIEDDPYRELRFAGLDLPSLKTLDQHERVISLGSFSKVLAPALRMGWLIADEPLLTQLRYLKDGADLESPALIQQAVYDYLTHNDYSAHLATLRSSYRQHRDWMMAALTKYLPAGYRFTHPDGGFFLFLTGPKSVDFDYLLRQVVGPRDRVLFVPSLNLYAGKNVQNSARISYAGTSEAEINLGIQKLSQALAALPTRQVASH